MRNFGNLLMTTKIIFSFFALVFTVTLTSSCEGSMVQKIPLGVFIWGDSNKLFQWNAADGKIRLLASLPQNVTIEYLTKISSKKFIFSTSAVSAKNHSISSDENLWLFDLITKKIKKLHSGMAPAYVSSGNKLFFYAYGSNENNELNLFVANYNGNMSNIKKIRKIGLYASIRPVIQTSSTDVVFYDDTSNPDKLLQYNFVTDTWNSLAIYNCFPVLWRSQTRQMLCANGDSFDYYLISLDGTRRTELGRLSFTIFSTYISDDDSALALRARQSGNSDTWLYSFKTGLWQRIIKLKGAAQGAGIWISGQ